MSFDGDGDSINLGTDAAFDFTNTDDFTLAGWVRIDSLNDGVNKNVVGLIGKNTTYAIDAYYSSPTNDYVQIRG